VSNPTQSELDEYRADARAWFEENTPADPGFMLPLTFMEVGTQQQFDFLRDWQNKVWSAGYLGANWPEQYGGRGLPEAFQNIATREMSRAGGPIMLNAIGLNWAGPLILDMGTDEERARYIKNILSAEDIWCQGFSEPENGSDLGNAQTKAVRDGDHWVINGSKIWTTQGNFAKYMILLARTNPDAPTKYKGLSFFLAPMDAEGIETVPIRKLTGEYGFTQTFFNDARIPADCLMGEEGEGWKVAMRTLEYERGARGGQPGGYVMTYPDITQVVELAKTAQYNGRPAIEDPLIRDELISLLMEARSLRLSSARTGMAPLNQERPLSIPLSSKLVSSEFMKRMAELATRLQGLRAAYYVGDPDALEKGIWQRGYLNSFSATIGGGTSEIQHNIVGEHVLGLPKS